MSTLDESAVWVLTGLNPSYEYRERELPPTATPDLPDYREQRFDVALREPQGPEQRRRTHRPEQVEKELALTLAP